jgi:hypothetical protein
VSDDGKWLQKDGQAAHCIGGVGARPAACGSDNAESGSSAATVHSADGIFTVGVPTGAAADGVEVSVALLGDSDLPEELRGPDIVVAAYEMSPDGAEFVEPLSIAFRVDPVELGLDLPAGGVPLGLILTEGADGELESLGGVIGRDGDMVVAEAPVEHFTPAFLVLSKTEAVALKPDALRLTIGDEASVKIMAAIAEIGIVRLDSLEDFDDPVILPTAEPPFTVFEGQQIGDLLASCDVKTNGEVPAFTVTVNVRNEPRLFADVLRTVLPGVAPYPAFRLGATGTCSEAETTGGGQLDDSDDQTDEEQSGESAAGSASDCTEREGCDPEGDTTGGSPDEDDESGGGAQAAAAKRAVDLISMSHEEGSHIFTMIVAGDGEGVSAAATTTSYSVSFRANHDPETFAMDFAADVSWWKGGPVETQTRDSEWEPFESTIDVVWLDSHTLQVTVSDMPFEVDVERMWMTIQVVIEDENGRIYADFSDDAFWDPS